jgi:protein-L-isoaspartate(D-aspartate) O-methyltransferase
MNQRPAMNFEQARYNMIEQQIRPWQVLDQSILSLLAVVRREDFVPAAWRESAFTDTEISLAGDDHHGAGDSRVMLSPKVEARILQELHVQRHEKVLEVGAGSGHMAALLAHQARRVHSVEIDPTLVAMASDNLRRAGVNNATVVHADGSSGLNSDAPFDVIVLSGSVPQVPAALLDQLTIGGRLVAIVGQAPVMRAIVYTRVAAEQWRQTVLFDTMAPRLQGFAEPSKFNF